MKFFWAYSKMSSRTYGELTIKWFVDSRPEQWDVTQFVKCDFNDDRNFGQHCDAVSECFTEEEVEQMRDYLKRVHGDDLEIKAAKLPGEKDSVMPTCWIGEGGGDRLIFLNKDAEYDLPFKVCGHFNIFENVEETDDPEFDIVIDKDGIVTTAGGEPIGMTDKRLPIKMMVEHVMKRYEEKPDEDIPDATRTPSG